MNFAKANENYYLKRNRQEQRFVAIVTFVFSPSKMFRCVLPIHIYFQFCWLVRTFSIYFKVVSIVRFVINYNIFLLNRVWEKSLQTKKTYNTENKDQRMRLGSIVVKISCDYLRLLIKQLEFLHNVIAHIISYKRDKL